MQINKKIIIGIVGENASGKSTLTNYICEKYNAKSFRFSDILSDVLTRIHTENSRENLQKLSTTLRQQFGEDILSKTLALDMTTSSAEVTVTEGIRRPSDIAFLKELPGFVLVAINTDMRTRFERLHTRGEKADDATKTWEDFLIDANHEAELQIKEIAATATITLDNNTTKENLFAQVNSFMIELCK